VPEQDNFFSRWSRRKLDARAEPAVLPAPPSEAAALPTLAPVEDDGTRLSLVPAPTTHDSDEPVPAETTLQAKPAAPPPPTLDDVALLDHDSSYSRFVARDVAPEVRNAAMKKLFTDPHFNVMDGLDTYIDDYGKPDPLPPGMLRMMVQSKMLGLFAAEDAADAEAARLAAADAVAATPVHAPADTEADAALPAPTEDGADIAAACGEIAASTPETECPAPAADENTDLQLQPVDDAGCAGPEAGPGQDPGRQH
jgi:hypothetical protein